MASPRFSVLLPTHNRADVVPFAIRSVLAQTYGDFELLIMGDGCTDQTAEIVSAFTDPRIRWFDLPKAPHFGAANRNVVLREARGDLIAYVSHDDLWLSDHLSLLGGEFEDSATEFAYSRPLLVTSAGVITPHIVNLNDPRTLESLGRKTTGIGITPVVHRRVALETYGYWNETLPNGSDSELFHRMITRSGRVNFSYLPIPTTFHFLANWRKESWRHTIKMKLLQLEGSIPPDLVIPIPIGVLQQKAVWSHLAADMPLRARQLRRAVQMDLDRRASGAYPSAVVTFFYEQYRRLIGLS